MTQIKKVVEVDDDGKREVGYKTPTGRMMHRGDGAKERAEALSERGQKAAHTRRLRNLISGG